MSSAIEQFASSISLKTFTKAEDLKKRIWFTLAALVIYRIGTYIPLPGINPEIISEFIQRNAGGFFGMLDMFSGGAIGRMTIFSLMIMPYISSSIIIQLLTSVSPHLEALKKEGETGRRKINQYTRYGTVFLASVQAYGIAVGLEKMTGLTGGSAVLDPGLFFRLTTMITLTGGTLFIMWLGEQITSRGIGNGISLLIYAGIVANLPPSVFRTIELGRTGALSLLVILGILFMVAVVIAYVVYVERAQRRILIQYPKRQVAPDRPAAAQTTHLPLKLNSAGVIPPIFASSLLLFPATIAGFSAGSPDSWLGTISMYLNHGTPLYISLYVFMIIFFAFFYTAIVFNPTETAENLRKMGAYVPGVRPGPSTANFIDFILTRLTAIGSLYLASVCILPEFILSRVGSLPFYLGGTSILIVVSVTIDTINQVQSHLLAHQYEGLIRKSRGKGNR
ncbi:MAG: preprotein translocase subunit SecY [Alphaproteobacteria bacterium]|nr:preprotein translocase subunit SecY [Alphaproteobacteria bacterium]